MMSRLRITWTFVALTLLLGLDSRAQGATENPQVQQGDAGATSEKASGSGATTPEPAPARVETEPEHAHESPLLLPGGIRIGGLFDASYERVGMDGGLTSGQNAFRNYHHFVFISRQGDDVPIGFNAEVIGQYFYELTARLWRAGSAFRLSARVGKIMVPFGPDPLFHKNYGGLSAIDQRLLPVVWSSFGACLRADALVKGFSLAVDLYLVQGVRSVRPCEHPGHAARPASVQRCACGSGQPRVAFARAGDVVVLAVLESAAFWPQPAHAGA